MLNYGKAKLILLTLIIAVSGGFFVQSAASAAPSALCKKTMNEYYSVRYAHKQASLKKADSEYTYSFNKNKVAAIPKTIGLALVQIKFYQDLIAPLKNSYNANPTPAKLAVLNATLKDFTNQINKNLAIIKKAQADIAAAKNKTAAALKNIADANKVIKASIAKEKALLKTGKKINCRFQ